MNCALTIAIENITFLILANSCMNFFIHSISLQPLVIAMYLASVVLKVMHFCNCYFHETVPPAKVIKYPKVDFLESTSPAISASTYPMINLFSFPNHKHCLAVPLRYLNIHFTLFQCSFPRFDRNILTTPTA